MKVQKNFDSKVFKKGQTIFNVDEPTDTLYLIQSGKVAIHAREGLKLATLESGEMFGELGFLTGEMKRTASAVAETECVINVIFPDVMQRKVDEADPVLRALVRNLTIRLSEANNLSEKYWLELNVYKDLT
ncbi:MAG TPA: cAMP-binding protein [Rhodobiaceae bacterium]|nr:cAMP-binding protein [Rhodobiaceae bacterium]